MAAKPTVFQLAITFSLLTTSGWGIPALALRSQDLFPLSCARFQQVPFPNPTHTWPWACWACLPALSLPALAAACLVGTQPSPIFLGCRKGETRRLEWLTKKTKGLCMFFTLTLHGSRSHPPAVPKRATQKEVGFSTSQACCLQNNKESWFMSCFKHPNPKSSKLKSVLLKDSMQQVFSILILSGPQRSYSGT